MPGRLDFKKPFESFDFWSSFRVQLILPGGRLCPGLPLRRCGLRCGDVLTALLQAVPEVVTTEKTFAAIADGAVITWGEQLPGRLQCI